MATSDGISVEDWDVVHDLALQIVNSPDSDKERYRYQMLEYLAELEVKYGSLPSILATRADYLEEEDPAREELLLRAHALAAAQTDTANVVYVAQSLAELYLDKRDLAEADRWLSTMRQHLLARTDTDYSEYERIRAEYRKLVIKSTQPADS
jgi:hypothetical protein